MAEGGAPVTPISRTGVPFPAGTEADPLFIDGGGGGGGDASAANQLTQITAEQAILAKIIAAPATEAKQGGGLPAALAAGGGLKIEGVAGGVAVPISGTVTTGGLTDTQLRATAVPVSGPLTDTQLRATAVPVSGTVAITAAQLPSTLGIKTAANSISIAPASDASFAVTGTFFQATQPVSGTFWQATQPVSGTVTVTGVATAAKQPALGVAGTASTDVLTVQGIASMTPLLVNGSGVTQPVSGTVTANLGTIAGVATEATLALQSAKLPASLGIKTAAASFSIAPASDASFAVTGTFWQATQPVSGTVTVTGVATETTLAAASAKLPASLGAKTGAASFSVVPASDGFAVTVSGTAAVTQSGTWNVTNISGTVSLPTGAATAAKQPALGTAGSASTDVITVQGIASGTAQPVSAASLPLPTGAATETSVAASATSLAIMDDWDESDRAKVNLIVGSAGVTGGAGNTDAATQRVVIATNQAAVPVSGPQTNAEYLAANRCTVTRTSVNSAATSNQLLAATAGRKSLTIVNTDANILYIDTSGGTATNACIPVASGASWTSAGAVPVGIITGIWASDGAGAATIFEGA